MQNFLIYHLELIKNYEKSEKRNEKYNVIYRKLEEYNSNMLCEKNIFIKQKYQTNVINDNEIIPLTSKVKNFEKRECYCSLKAYIEKEIDNKICILYGLRRTGKSTLLFQILNELNNEKRAYIKIQSTDNMKNLIEDLYTLFSEGYRYVFIDEITLMDDFINTSSILADIFVAMGMKIVISGTDSLGFNRTIREELYDRFVLIHTSFISFKEYQRLLKINSIDKYIEYGGTLKIENMSFDDPDYDNDNLSFLNDESTRKYIDTSISRNIQKSLKNDNNGKYFNELQELYDNGELTNVINRIVQNINHQFLLHVVTDKFKFHDLGSSKELLLHDFPKPASTVLYDIDEVEVIERLKKLINIKEQEETSVKITQSCVDKVKVYLEALELLVKCTKRYEGMSESSIFIISQPGMRYAISKALIYLLLQDKYFNSVSEDDKEYIINKILSDVKGRMLEDIVLLERTKRKTFDEEVFKFEFTNGGEFDMVIYNKKINKCQLYEIKYSNRINEKEERYLNDFTCCNIISKHFGDITDKYVIYRGDNKIVDGIQYINVENYLSNL